MPAERTICNILLYLIVRKIDLLGSTAKIRDTLCSAADDANWMSQCHLLWQYIAIPDIDGGAKVSRAEQNWSNITPDKCCSMYYQPCGL